MRGGKVCPEQKAPEAVSFMNVVSFVSKITKVKYAAMTRAPDVKLSKIETLPL